MCIRDRLVAAVENGKRREARTAFEGASKWCARQGLTLSATLLLCSGDAICPDATSTKEALAALVPDGFPWSGEADGSSRWKLSLIHISEPTRPY